MAEKKQEQLEEAHEKSRKPYVKPEIVHELELETRAGSPLDLPDPFDPAGVGQ